MFTVALPYLLWMVGELAALTRFGRDYSPSLETASFKTGLIGLMLLALHILLDTLAPNDQPRSLEEGYAIQQVVTAEWPDRIAGWKVGATSKEVQTLFEVTEPIYGPVFQSQVFQSPATLSARHFQHRLLESEFVFRFGKDMPSRPRPYTRSEIIDAVDALVPGIEIINPRFRSLTDPGVKTSTSRPCGQKIKRLASRTLAKDSARGEPRTTRHVGAFRRYRAEAGSRPRRRSR